MSESDDRASRTPIEVQLTPDEALVLVEWLSTQLEKILLEPFDPAYSAMLATARQRLVARIAPEGEIACHKRRRSRSLGYRE